MRRPLLTLVLCTATALLSSCSDAALPARSLQRDDCLRSVRLQQLQQAIARCNQVVARFSQDPQPRSERSLLLALAGDDQAACRDIEAAHQLAKRAKPGSLDPLLAAEIDSRRRSCRS